LIGFDDIAESSAVPELVYPWSLVILSGAWAVKATRKDENASGSSLDPPGARSVFAQRGPAGLETRATFSPQTGIWASGPPEHMKKKGGVILSAAKDLLFSCTLDSEAAPRSAVLGRTCVPILALLLLCLAASWAHGETDLYGQHGISPQAVRQGALGSCYFHASIAALAQVRPDLLRQAIQSDEKGGLSVRFADGKIERVYPQDVQFARSSGFDLSEGLWVAVLFRGYAQRTLRIALTEAISKSAFPPQLKSLTSGLVGHSDTLLLAYDRAIRSQIGQLGDLSREGLKARLRQELASVPLLSFGTDRALELVDSSGFFEALAADIKANGELFGAYRAVGQGGIPGRVLTAFAGGAHSRDIIGHDDAAAAISSALQKHEAVVAWTGVSSAHTGGETPLPSNDPADWFAPRHCYTVLALNPAAGTATLRNPWGDHPDPHGEFTLPLDVFISAYAGFTTSDTPQPGQP